MSYFDRARALLAKRKRHHLVSREFVDGLVGEMADAARQVIRLEKRRDELLATIAQLSKDAVSPAEAEELRGQIARLIAEVGTLRFAGAVRPHVMSRRMQGKRFWQETEAKVAAMTAMTVAAIAAGAPPEPGEVDERPTLDDVNRAVEADVDAAQAWED